MNKTWLVIKHEYLRHVKRKRFIMAVLSMPIFILFIIIVGMITVALSFNDKPIGYIDQAGVLTDPLPYIAEDPLPFHKPLQILPFQSEEDARAALDNKSIQTYYILAEDYLQTGKATAVANKTPDSEITSEFRKFLRINLLKNTPADITERILNGGNIEIIAKDDGRKMEEENIIAILLPFIAGFLFMMAVNISGGYLLQAVVEEKENRTIEILVTSISPNQLMTGKVIGNLSVGLTQLVIWILFGAIGVGVLMNLIPELRSAQVDTSFLFLMVLTFIPAFIMIAAMMATLGATTTDMQEAQQVSGLFTIPIVIPFWFVGVLMEKPNSPLAIGLSLFPFTAPISLPLRAAFTTIPAWQIILTVSLLVFFAIAALWLAGRAFRLGLLRYGKRLSIKELLTRKP